MSSIMLTLISKMSFTILLTEISLKSIAKQLWCKKKGSMLFEILVEVKK